MVMTNKKVKESHWTWSDLLFNVSVTLIWSITKTLFKNTVLDLLRFALKLWEMHQKKVSEM